MIFLGSNENKAIRGPELLDLLSEVHPFQIGPKKSQLWPGSRDGRGVPPLISTCIYIYIVNTYTVIYIYICIYIYIYIILVELAVVSLIFIQNIHLQYTETDSIPAQRSLPRQSYGLTAEQQRREEHESGVLRATNEIETY